MGNKAIANAMVLADHNLDFHNGDCNIAPENLAVNDGPSVSFLAFRYRLQKDQKPALRSNYEA